MINSSSYRTYHIQTRSSNASTVVPVHAGALQRVMLRLYKINWLRYFVHAGLWLAFYCLPALVLLAINENPPASFFNPLNPAYCIAFALVIVFTYFNHYWLVPGLFLQQKFIGYFVLVAAFVAVTSGFQYMAMMALAPGGNSLTAMNYLLLLLVVAVCTSVIIYQYKKITAARTEISKLKTALLNSQVNPHFLFNSLNWIYLLALGESKETPNAIIQLSGMMRYLLQASQSDLIDLKKELAIVRSYVSLQKGRLGDTISLDCTLPVYTGAGKIAPLLLMSFIENAFKHGVNPNEDSAISIDISIVNNRISAQVINNKVTTIGYTAASGLGLKNTQERLRLLYPAAHQLEILEDNKIYSVKLSMQIL